MFFSYFWNFHSVLECTWQLLEYLLLPDVVWFCWLSLLLLVLFQGLGWWLFMNFILFTAHMEYFLPCKVSSGCAYLWSNSFWLEHTLLIQRKRVLMKLYLDEMMWWLSHWRYRSLWVCFLYTLMSKVPSCYSVTSVSKNGIDTLGLVSSTVNLMLGSTKLMWLRNVLIPQIHHLHTLTTDIDFWSCAECSGLKILH